MHECDLHRFEDVHLAPAYIHERGCQNFVEVYDIIHPLQPMESPRPLRTSPFYPRQRELGAYFLESAGWERPHWYDVNAPLTDGIDLPVRDSWSARYWSPIAAAEAQATRERVAMYDMTPLKRLAVTGAGAEAFLQRLTTNNVARSVGIGCLHPAAGRERAGSAATSPLPDWVGTSSRSARTARSTSTGWSGTRLPTVRCRYATSPPAPAASACGARVARDLVQPLTEDDFSHQGFRYFRARRTFVGNVPVTAMRLSYVGELGWELYTTADLGLKLWDTLWKAGQALGVVAAGRSAFNSLRLEKGYRAWGTDMTTEHTPAEAGLDFAVRMDKGEFVGREAIAGQAPESVKRRLTALVLDNHQVVMGKEPVYVDGKAAGYVTSAAYAYSLNASIAYAWLPTEAATPGTRVDIEYFGERLPATAAAEPLFDPAMDRIRR